MVEKDTISVQGNLNSRDKSFELTWESNEDKMKVDGENINEKNERQRKVTMQDSENTNNRDLQTVSQIEYVNDKSEFNNLLRKNVQQIYIADDGPILEWSTYENQK